MSTILCPFCFQEFNGNTVHWRCHHSCKDPATNEPPGEIDEVYAEFLNEMNQLAMNVGNQTSIEDSKRRLGHTITDIKQKRLSKNKIFCDWCNKQVVQPICPRCHSNLPVEYSNLGKHIIAIVGAAGVGKSHYIASLIKLLRNEIGSSFSFSIMDLNDETTERFKNDFEKPLFEQKRKLKKSEEFDRLPLIYRLKNRGRSRKRKKEIIIVFFDTAGENFDSEDKLGLYARYVRHASAIILLIDPLQMTGVLDHMHQQGSFDLLENSGVIPSQEVKPPEIMTRVIRQFEAFGMSQKDGLISVPLSVAFTKLDVLKDQGMLPPGNLLYSTELLRGTFNDESVRMINDEVKAFVHTWESQELDNLLVSHFKDYSYFALSALGRSPDIQGNLQDGVTPFRVEDPFLWSLSKVNYI